MKIYSPKRVRHSYTQNLDAPPKDVFPLLCPVREMEWVQGWNPEAVISNSGLAEADCVFVTPGKPQQTVWIITRYNADSYQLEMIKVTPNHTVGKLEIALSKKKEGGTSAEVVYTYTSIGPEGNVFLKQFTHDWYHDFMQRWEQALNHYLTTGEKWTH